CYACGDGVPQDDTKAVEWHRKAAEQGLAMSQDILGLCYACGKPPNRGVRKPNATSVVAMIKGTECRLTTRKLSNGIGKRQNRGMRTANVILEFLTPLATACLGMWSKHTGGLNSRRSKVVKENLK